MHGPLHSMTESQRDRRRWFASHDCRWTRGNRVCCSSTAKAG